jgi:hypothetical protein
MRTDVDRLEDVIDDIGVVLEGIRSRGGIREFFREWPDAAKARFIEQTEHFCLLLAAFIRDAEVEVTTLDLSEGQIWTSRRPLPSIRAPGARPTPGP